MSFLNANLQALEKNHKGLAKYLQQRFHPQGALRVVATASGQLSAQRHAHWLHSSRDPRREATRLIQQLLTEGYAHLLFYGFGLGYYVEAFSICKGPFQQGVVIIPDGNEFLQALELRDMRATLSAPLVHWLIEVEHYTLERLLQELPFGKVGEVRPAPLLKAHHHHLAPLQELYRRFQRHRQINLTTQARFGKLWMRNLGRNLPRLAAMYDLSKIAGLFRGLPALVIGAGASLDELRELLPTMRQHLLLIAVDTALQPLAHLKVHPDIIVTVDPQYWNSRYMDYIDGRSSLLVVEPAVYPRALRHHGPQTLFFASHVPLARLLQQALGVALTISGGGSVATSGWEIGAWVGASAIYFAGIDLGYPQHRVHCHGCYFEEQMHRQSNRCHPAEGQYLRYLRSAPLLTLPANDGGTLLSDQRLKLYVEWLENRLQHPSSPPTYTFSRQGAHIKGVAYQSWEQLEQELAPLHTRREIERRRQRGDEILRKADGAFKRRQQQQIDEALQGYRQSLAQLKECLQEAIALCQVILASSSSATATQEHQLQNIEHHLIANPHRHILSSTMPLLNLNATGAAVNGYQASLTLYRQLLPPLAEQQKLLAAMLAGLPGPSS